jgi:hypothetical protein
MRHVLSRRFDALEARKLLSTAHVAAATPAPATALVLNGPLAVDVKSPTAIDNLDGSITTSVSISGRFGALGKGFGVWNDSVDELGDYLGPDTLVLKFDNHYSKGTITLEFNNVNTGKAHPMGHGQGYFQHAERFESGTGDFANASQKGSVNVIVNSKNGTVEGLSLVTAPT